MILMYHKIYPESPTVWWVTPNDFWRQMEELRRYRVVPLDEYEPSDPEHAAITFDGIYENVFTYALPILKRFGYPFELFIVGEAVGTDNEFDQDAEPPARFAGISQLEAMVREGGRLQWHGRSHRDLSALENCATIDGELCVPEDIRKIDPNGFTWFAYPNGKHSDLAIERVRKAFRGAVSCVEGDDHNLYKLNRVKVTNETSFARSTVSLIVANYNYGRYAAEAIESALHQTVQPDEILFIDDCSTDNSVEVAERYKDRIRIVRNEKNLGIVGNFNKAVSLTEGEYICFLGADNRLRSDYIEKCKLALDTHKDAAIAYTNAVLFGPRAEAFSVKPNTKPVPNTRDVFLREFPELDENTKKDLHVHNVMHGSSMYRRCAFEEVGGYKESDGHEDHNLFARMVDKGWGAVLCPEFLLEYRQHSPEQASARVNLGMDLAYYRRQLKEKRSEISRLQDVVARVVRKEQAIVETSKSIAQHVGTGELERASRSAGSAFRQFPEQARLLHMYALLLEHQGLHREAERQLEQALLYDPTYAKVHNDLGTLCFRRGDEKKALYHFEQALECDPTYRVARENLVALCLATGRAEEAERIQREALPELPDEKVSTVRISSYDAYKKHASDRQSEYADRERYEKSLFTDSEPFTVNGHCYVCKRKVGFLVDYSYSYEVNGVLTPNWRERLVCPSCGLNNRMRASIHLFEQLLQPNKESSIYMAEQTTPVYRWFARNYSNVFGSEYLGAAVPFGATNENGLRNESITELSFSDGEFDFVLTFDVFEHIADFQQAFRECYRVLKPTGILFFTVPFNVAAQKNGFRAVVKGNGEIEHVLPPDHHGPWLVFNQFGWEMLDRLREIGFHDVGAHLYWSKEMGYLGRRLAVFIATKGRGSQCVLAPELSEGVEEACSDAGAPQREAARPPEVLFKKGWTATSAKNNMGLICLRPFYWMNFFYENVHCCCPGWTKLSIGNIKEKTIAEVWNSEQARYVRRKMYGGEWQDICNPICPLIVEHRYQNRFIKYSELEKFDFLTPKLIEEIRRQEDLLESPPTLFKPDNSNRCNLSCIMCDRQAHADDPELIEKTAEDMFHYLSTTKIIILSGIGDPFAIPYARDWLMNPRNPNSALRFDLITNGLLLPRYWERIKQQRFGSLMISIDAATRETYEKIRVGGSWDDLLRSLSLIRENRHRFGSVGISMTVMRSNYREIPAFVDFAESYGFGASFQKIRGTHGDENIFEMGDCVAVDELRTIFFGERAKKRGVAVYWSNLLDLAHGERGR